MIDKSRYRNSFLSFTCIGFCLATFYSFIQPTLGNRQVSSFSFPDRIPLDSWQLIKTEPISNNQLEENKQKKIIAANKSYTYGQENLSLKVEMLYLVGTSGIIHNVLEKQLDITENLSEKADIQKLEDIGFHILFVDRDKAYLSSCINSRGNTTVDHNQFARNRYAYDLKFKRILHWLFGQNTILDRRCLLSTLSIPVENLQPEIAYEILQEAWQDWYSWWQPQFPNL